MASHLTIAALRGHIPTLLIAAATLMAGAILAPWLCTCSPARPRCRTISRKTPSTPGPPLDPPDQPNTASVSGIVPVAVHLPRQVECGVTFVQVRLNRPTERHILATALRLNGPPTRAWFQARWMSLPSGD